MFVHLIYFCKIIRREVLSFEFYSSFRGDEGIIPKPIRHNHLSLIDLNLYSLVRRKAEDILTYPLWDEKF